MSSSAAAKTRAELLWSQTTGKTLSRASKYKNTPTVVDGKRYASKKEAGRGSELKMLERAGVIHDLKEQVLFTLTVNRIVVCKYIADFVYRDKSGKLCVEDSKGYKTEAFKLKCKLMRAVHGIEVIVS